METDWIPFAILVIVGFVAGLVFGLATLKIDGDEVKLAEHLCEANGGIDKISAFTIICENGARFSQ